MESRMEDLVSIIMPAYNCADFIEETIKTVQAQTYQKWELLVIDDQSTDITKQVLTELSEKDSRIKYIELEQNSGAATARNRGIKEAKGQYIAFLDSDDLWKTEKLEKQLYFMKEHHYAFTFTSYELIDDAGQPLHKCVMVPEQIDYDTLLYDTPIFTSAVMYEKKNLSSAYMPNLVNGEDVAMWLKMLKIVPYAYGLNENLVFYRVREHSLSAGIVTKLKRRWEIYRKSEDLPLTQASRYYLKYLFSVIRKRKRN